MGTLTFFPTPTRLNLLERVRSHSDTSAIMTVPCGRVWTSFLDGERWGGYGTPLSPSDAREIARYMLEYDSSGLNVWIGEVSKNVSDSTDVFNCQLLNVAGFRLASHERVGRT
jgi:hypothetical protein